MEKQTAMMQLLAQLKDERENMPLNIEWARCYQAIEMVIKNTYIPLEKEQHSDTWDKALDTLEERGVYIRAWEDFDEYWKDKFKNK